MITWTDKRDHDGLFMSDGAVGTSTVVRLWQAPDASPDYAWDCPACSEYGQAVTADAAKREAELAFSTWLHGIIVGLEAAGHILPSNSGAQPPQPVLATPAAPLPAEAAHGEKIQASGDVLAPPVGTMERFRDLTASLGQLNRAEGLRQAADIVDRSTLGSPYLAMMLRGEANKIAGAASDAIINAMHDSLAKDQKGS